ncbi:MAG: hypothetical protein AB7V46_04280 [Thermomicrobiales bacterium]
MFTVAGDPALAAPVDERIAERIEFEWALLVSATLAILDEGSGATDSASNQRAVVRHVAVIVFITDAAGTAIAVILASTVGDQRAIEGAAGCGGDTFLAGQGAGFLIGRVRAGPIRTERYAAGARVLAAVGRAFLIVAIEDTRSAYAKLTIAAVGVVVTTDTTVTIATLAAEIALVFANAAFTIADAASGAAWPAGTFPVAVADATSPEAGEAIAAVVVCGASAAFQAGAHAITAERRAVRARAGRIHRAIRNVAAVERAIGILNTLLAGTAELVRILRHSARAVRAAERPAAAPVIAALVGAPCVAVEDALSVITTLAIATSVVSVLTNAVDAADTAGAGTASIVVVAQAIAPVGVGARLATQAARSGGITQPAIEYTGAERLIAAEAGAARALGTAHAGLPRVAVSIAADVFGTRAERIHGLVLYREAAELDPLAKVFGPADPAWTAAAAGIALDAIEIVGADFARAAITVVPAFRAGAIAETADETSAAVAVVGTAFFLFQTVGADRGAVRLAETAKKVTTPIGLHIAGVVDLEAETGIAGGRRRGRRRGRRGGRRRGRRGGRRGGRRSGRAIAHTGVTCATWTV